MTLSLIRAKISSFDQDGLGLRYAFIGPMETIHLNAAGLKSYCETYGDTIHDVSSDMGPIPNAWRMRNDSEKAQVFTIITIINR